MPSIKRLRKDVKESCPEVEKVQVHLEFWEVVQDAKYQEAQKGMLKNLIYSLKGSRLGKL